jgi:hypothetical protein
MNGIPGPPSALAGTADTVARGLGLDEQATSVAMADATSEDAKIRMVLRDT